MSPEAPRNAGGTGGVSALSVLVGWFVVGILVAAIVIPIFGGGGVLWLTPVVVWPLVIGYMLYARSVAGEEGRHG